MSLDYDQYLNMPSYGSPMKQTLDTITEVPTVSSSITAVTVSPLDFSGQLEAFLQSDDSSTSTEEMPQPTPWTSPRLPNAKRKAGAENYLMDVLELADQENQRQKRARFTDLGASPKKREKMVTRLDDLANQETHEDMLSDSDLIKLQMLALHGLRQDKAELVTRVRQLEDERARLVEVNQQQTDRRLAILNGFIKRRGQELTRYGGFLLALVEEENSTSTG